MASYSFLTFSVCVLLQFDSWVDAQGSNFRSISCHQCSPLTVGANCAELGSNTTLGNCTNFGISDVVVSCYSAYLNYSIAQTPGIGWGRTNRSAETGVYRGCAQRQENITDFCAFYSAQVSSINVTIVSCQTCEEDQCNSHRFNSVGQIISSGETLHSLSVLIMCIVISLTLFQPYNVLSNFISSI